MVQFFQEFSKINFFLSRRIFCISAALPVRCRRSVPCGNPPRRFIFSPRSLAHTAACPCCDQISASLHATYHRRIQTLPLRRKYTCLRMTAYKFDCVNPRCPQKVFMESLFPADRWQVRSRQLTALNLALSAFLKDEGGQQGSGCLRRPGQQRHHPAGDPPGSSRPLPPGLSRQNAAAYFPCPAGKVFPAGDPCTSGPISDGTRFPSLWFPFFIRSWLLDFAGKSPADSVSGVFFQPQGLQGFRQFRLYPVEKIVSPAALPAEIFPCGSPVPPPLLPPAVPPRTAAQLPPPG